MEDKTAMSKQNAWHTVMNAVLKLPGVKVDRRGFLSKAFSKYCDEGTINDILENGTRSADVPLSVLDKVAAGVIKHHGTVAIGTSFITGLPGGPAMLGTVPADLAQYYYHTLQVAQKLAYVYGYPDFDDWSDEERVMIFTIFVGVMMGVSAAGEVLKELSKNIGTSVAKKLFRTALTRTAYYPVIKQIAGFLGVKITTKTFAGTLGKIIPIVGGFISGSLTAAMFFKCANRLKNRLKEDV